MKGKKKNVPPVTETAAAPSEPKKPASPATEEDEQVAKEIQEAKGAPVVPQAAAPIQIPKKVLEQAKALGVDLGQIVDWAQNVEQRFAVVEENFQKVSAFLVRMEPLVKLGEQIQQRQTQAQATGATAPTQGGGIDLGMILSLADKLTSSGGGSNPITEELTKKIIDAGLSQMTAGTTLLQAVEKKILADMGTKIATEAIPK